MTMTGVSANGDVSVFNAKQLGQRMVDSMTGTVDRFIFDNCLMLRSPQKAVLADAVWKTLPPDIAGPTGEVRRVLDGGTLLHHIQRPQGFPTYRQLCSLYCVYVSQYFGSVIVRVRRLPQSVHQTRDTSTAHRR